MNASVISTYRCNAKCHMCNIWKYPTSVGEEIKPSVLEKLPKLDFCNITGGEPFIRDDMEEIVDVLKRKAGRVVISTNGYYTDRIISIARKYKDIGIRVSVEGLPAANDELRGLKDGFDHGLRTILELKRLGLKDIGFGITVSDRNAKDMIELFQLAELMGIEFATAALHNSYYFHTQNNRIKNVDEVTGCFEDLIEEMLKTRKVKNWFRAYFNYGLINYIKGKKRLLPCEAGTENFFIDPSGEILPCNGMEERYWLNSMGNLNSQSFEEIWNGPRARSIRDKVKGCPKNCWMIGSVSPVMKKYIRKPAKWVITNKLRGYKRGLRIAVLGTRGFPNVQGGIERHCEELYSRLALKGCQIRIYGRKGYISSHKYKYKGVNIFPLWTPKIKSLEAIIHTLYGIFHARFDRKGFDILHIHAVGPSLLVPLAKLLGFRVVTTNHGPDYDRQKWGNFAKKALRFGEMLGAKYSNGVIAVSQVIKNKLENRFHRKVNYIPNGVTIPDSIQSQKYLNSLKLGARKYILAVGRLVPEKGFHDLLEAYKCLNTDWKLVIAGGADHEDFYSKNLKKLAAEDNRVVMTGMIDSAKLGELYSTAGLFILPSYHEGLPIVMLEALSYGLNVLCSSIPANTEVIGDEKSLFPAGNIAKMKNRLETYLAKHEYSLLNTNRSYDKLEEYNWDSIAEKTLKVYQGLIDGDTGDEIAHDNIIENFETVNRITPKLIKKEKEYERVS